MKKFQRHILILVLAAYVAASISVAAAPGDLDLTFGNGGIVTTHLLDIGHYYGPSAILLQPDGKILVSGQIDEYGDLTGFFIARFNSDGSPDLSFGYQGMLLPTLEYGGTSVGAEIALQPDGKIVAVGAHGKELAVRRFETTGELDWSFGDGGGVNFVPAGTLGADAFAVALQPDGKMVVAGKEHGFEKDTSGLIARLNPDGSLDDNFGTDGIIIVTSLGELLWFKGIRVQSNGKLLAFGDRRVFLNSNSSDVVVMGFNSDGSPDNSFAVNGILIDSVADTDYYLGAGLQPDGNIIVASLSYDPYALNRYRKLARYYPDGSVDAGFSANTVFPLNQYGVNNIAFQSNGKILAFGSSTGSGSPSFTSTAVLRLHPNGTLDTTFGTNGASTIPLAANTYYAASSGVIQPDGRIVVLINRQDYNTYQFSLARFQGDPTFSISGRVTTPSGLGLRNASVTLTDSSGNRRTVLSSSLGFYSFTDIPLGQTVTISAASRRYRFEPVTRMMNENLSGLDLVGVE